MKSPIRLLAVAAALVGTLALAGPAGAAYTSATLRVNNPSEQPSGGGAVTISVTTAREDDPTARATIYIPHGYTLALDQAPGTQIGTVAAQVNATASGPEIVVPLDGVIRTVAPADVAVPAAQCLGPGVTPQTVWLLVLTLPTGGTLSVPMFVLPASAAEGAFAQAKLVVCLSTPATATLGAKLIEARLTLQGVFTNPAARGAYTWRAIFTPWASNAGPLNPAGTVETQAVDQIGVRANLRAGRYTKRTKRLAVSGTTAEGTTGVAAMVSILLNGRRVARVRSNAAGAFRASIRIRRPGRYVLRAVATAPARTFNSCTPTLPTVPTCVRSTSAAFSVTSAQVRVRIRK
jgi:hypothetical protein